MYIYFCFLLFRKVTPKDFAEVLKYWNISSWRLEWNADRNRIDNYGCETFTYNGFFRSSTVLFRLGHLFHFSIKVGHYIVSKPLITLVRLGMAMVPNLSCWIIIDCEKFMKMYRPLDHHRWTWVGPISTIQTVSPLQNVISRGSNFKCWFNIDLEISLKNKSIVGWMHCCNSPFHELKRLSVLSSFLTIWASNVISEL